MENPITVYITADSLISSLGLNTQENVEAIREYRSGISMHKAGLISDEPILAATITPRLSDLVRNLGSYTRLEQLFILTIQKILSYSGISLANKDCGLILSTTKGNVDILSDHPTEPDSRVFLWEMGKRIGEYFYASNRVEIISNACISGVSALIIAKRWIESGRYKKVIVAGAFLISLPVDFSLSNRSVPEYAGLMMHAGMVLI